MEKLKTNELSLGLNQTFRNDLVDNFKKIQDGVDSQSDTINSIKNQADSTMQQTLDFDNEITNSLAINSALGNKPFSAIGNVRLDLQKGKGVIATNNDTSATKKGVTISVANSFNVYYFDETLKMVVRNNDSSAHTFIVDYVGVKTDGTRLALCSPLTKFTIPAVTEVNVTTAIPKIDSVSTVAYSDLDHLEIMTYTEADTSCQMLISRAKIYNQRRLPDVNNEKIPDSDELLNKDLAYGSNLNSEKVFVENLNKTCQRFYTTTGGGVWSVINIPMRSVSANNMHIDDGKKDRPLKGSVVVKVPTDAAAIGKYGMSFRIYDTNGKQYIYDVKNANERLKGNVLKYEFSLPSINSLAPNTTFDHLELAITAYDIANFDVTLINASLKFNQADTTIITRQNDDLAESVMKALNEGDNTFVSTSGAVNCTISTLAHRNAFKITKDLSSDSGNSGKISILLPDFEIDDLWVDKELDIFAERQGTGNVTLPMQLTIHLADGSTVPVDLNPLYLFQAQVYHAQKIPALSSKTTAAISYVTLDFTFNDTTTWTAYIKDISFKTYVKNGTQDMNYLPDKSAKLPQLKLFGDLKKLASKNDKMVVPCSFVNHEQVINGYASLKWQGNSTVMWPKKSYTVALFLSLIHI